MGKLQSKHACKRRENPEGGSFAANAVTCQRECDRVSPPTHKIKIKQELCQSELKVTQTHDHDCHLEVLLPPERREQKSSVVLEDAQQEWVFTLYDFDNGGKDMSSLMQSIYEVMEASFKQPSSSSAALRVRLVVTPASGPARHSPTVTGHNQEVERKYYSVDENTERRNHYLDLAGIENYSSKFDDTDPSTQENARSARQRSPVVTGENCGASASRGRGLSFLRSLRGKAKVAEGGKTARSHGYHPALWCQPQAQHPLQRSHSKRFRSRGQDAAGSPSRTQLTQHQSTGSGQREMLPSRPSSCGGLVALTKRHHHHHEHHHHHHHHHYHPT